MTEYQALAEVRLNLKVEWYRRDAHASGCRYVQGMTDIIAGVMGIGKLSLHRHRHVLECSFMFTAAGRYGHIHEDQVANILSQTVERAREGRAEMTCLTPHYLRSAIATIADRSGAREYLPPSMSGFA